MLKLLLGRIQFRHEQILSQRGMKDMALLRNEHQALIKRRRSPAAVTMNISIPR